MSGERGGSILRLRRTRSLGSGPMSGVSLSLHSPCDCARVCVGDGSGLFSCFKSNKSQWLKTADDFALSRLTIMGCIKINTFFYLTSFTERYCFVLYVT